MEGPQNVPAVIELSRIAVPGETAQDSIRRTQLQPETTAGTENGRRAFASSLLTFEQALGESQPSCNMMCPFSVIKQQGSHETEKKFGSHLNLLYLFSRDFASKNYILTFKQRKLISFSDPLTVLLPTAIKDSTEYFLVAC
jgi:hypothetical protein